MTTLCDLLQTTFWNKLEELTDWSRSNASAFKILNKIKEDDNKTEQSIAAVFSVNPTNKETILRKIESIVIDFLEELSNGCLPKFTLNKRGSYENTKYTEGKGVEMLTDVTSHGISLENSNSLRKYAVMMSCLTVCYKLLQKGLHSTKRDIYYSNVAFFQNQHAVDEAIADISCMLGVPRHSLNVLSSSKGLIGGDLKFKDADGNVLKCCVSEGIQVPSSIEKLYDFESRAKYVLVIEKEATYQRLMEFNLSEKLGPCILLTGIGEIFGIHLLSVTTLFGEFRGNDLRGYGFFLKLDSNSQFCIVQLVYSQSYVLMYDVYSYKSIYILWPVEQVWCRLCENLGFFDLQKHVYTIIFGSN